MEARALPLQCNAPTEGLLLAPFTSFRWRSGFRDTAAALALSILLLLSMAPVPSAAQSLPDTLRLGEHRLVLTAFGTRPEAMAARYRLGVYLPDGVPLLHLGMHDLPKTFLLRLGPAAVDWPILPGEWMHNLLPPLSAEEWDYLSARIEDMREGEWMRIDYTPDHGTLIRIEGEPVLGHAGHALFAGFVRTWLGATPASDALKRDLLDSAASLEPY